MMLYEQEKMSRYLYLSSEISRESVADIIHAIELINQEDDAFDDEVENQVQSLIQQGIIEVDSMQYPTRQPIILEINSGGGEVPAGFQLLTAIENSNTPIIGYVTGWCMSMAIPIFASCNYRMASEYSEFMIHDISSGTVGKYTEMKKYLENGMALSRNNYIKSVVKYSKLKEDEMVDIMEKNHDFAFSPYDAIKYGILDSIDSDTDVEKMANKLYYGESDEEKEEELLIEKQEIDNKEKIVNLLTELLGND